MTYLCNLFSLQTCHQASRAPGRRLTQNARGVGSARLLSRKRGQPWPLTRRWEDLRRSTKTVSEKLCHSARRKASAQVTSSTCPSCKTDINTHPGTLAGVVPGIEPRLGPLPSGAALVKWLHRSVPQFPHLPKMVAIQSLPHRAGVSFGDTQAAHAGNSQGPAPGFQKGNRGPKEAAPAWGHTARTGRSWDLNPGWLGTKLKRRFLPWTPTSQVPANQEAPWRRTYPSQGPKDEEGIARHDQEGGRERDTGPGSHRCLG